MLDWPGRPAHPSEGTLLALVGAEQILRSVILAGWSLQLTLLSYGGLDSDQNRCDIF